MFTEEESAAQNVDFATRADRRSQPGTTADIGAYNAFWWDWGTVLASRRASLIVDPPDGKLPPLTPEAQNRKVQEAETRRGIETDAPTPGGWVNNLGSGGLRVRCLVGFNSGPPMTPNAYNNNVQLIQTAEYLAILNEMITIRIIPLDGRPHGRSVNGPAIREAAGKETRWSLTQATSGPQRSRIPGSQSDLLLNLAQTCIWSNASHASMAIRSLTNSRCATRQCGQNRGPRSFP